MIIQHNIMALNSYNKLSTNNSAVQKNLEKLSSGYRINRAGDDAAGLAISEKMRAQITGLERAKLNAQDGISLVQTAEGALTEVHSILNRLVELGTESANGIYQAEDRQKIQDEVNQSLEEIDRISKATNFNGIKLLDGSLGASEGKFSKTSTSGITYTTTDATQGNFQIGNPLVDPTSTGGGATTLTGSTGLLKKDGDKIDLTLEYMVNGVKSSVNVSYTWDGQATDADVLKNLAEQVKGSAMKNDFTITGDGATDLTFKAKEAGASKGAVMSNINFSVTQYDTPQGTKVTTGSTAIGTKTAGTDAFTTIGGTSSVASTDNDSAIEDKIITINGKQFAFAADSAAAVKLANKFSNVNVVMASGTAKTDNEAMAALIQKETGIQAVGDAAGLKVFATGTSGGSGGNGLTLQIGDTADDFNKVTVSVDNMSASGLGINGLQVTDQGIAADSITRVKSAIEKVSTNRGRLGALQNRLEHTINNLSTTAENMTAAESRVRDTDMAKEMMAFTKNNVLVQAAQSMLAQANQQPQQVLQLLR